MTDSAGLVTPSGANNNVISDLPDGMKDVSLSSVSGADNSSIHVKFAEGAGNYVALDFTLEVNNAVTCTVDVYFRASKTMILRALTAPVIYDQYGNKLGQIEETTGMSLFAEAVDKNGLLIGFIYFIRHYDEQIGKQKIQITEGYSYTLYCESEPLPKHLSVGITT